MRSMPSPNADAPPRRPRLPEPTVATRIAIQFQVVTALMIRNIMGRYGRGNLGFLWLIIEPMFLVGGIILLWSFLYPGGKHGVSIAAFVISGYLPLTLWRHLIGTPRLMSGNFGLLYHRRMTVLDVVVARALTEIAGVSTAGVVVFLMLYSVGAIDWIEDPALVLAGWLMMCWLGFGMGCLIAGLSEKSEVIENLVQPTQYLLLPVSGVFFMVAWLPKTAQDYVLLVPLAHVYEMFRAGFLGRAVETHYSFGYVSIWATVLTVLGIWSMLSSRKRLAFR